MSVVAPHSGERRALEARRERGLGEHAPLDVLRVVEEKFDVPVFITRFDDDKIAGVLLRRPGGDCFVGVNADHHTVRQRFTLAHELGHLYMGHQARVDLANDVFGKGSNREEVEANYFAAEFLAPRATVRAWLEERELVTQATAPSTVAQIALEFGISVPTACIRLERAGAISPKAKSQLLTELTGDDVGALVKRYAAHRFNDSLWTIFQSGAYPRVPRDTTEYATRAHDAGLIDAEEYAAIVPNAPEFDYTDWLS